MSVLPRWWAPAVLAAGLGFGAMVPAPAHAQDTLTRVLVDIADVVFDNGAPYYRYSDYGSRDRLAIGRDAYGRRVYYRQVPYYGNAYNQSGYDGYGRRAYNPYIRRNTYARYNQSQNYYRNAPPYGNAYGYYRNDNRDDGCRDGRCRDRDEDRGRDRDRDNDRGWGDDRRHGDDDND